MTKIILTFPQNLSRHATCESCKQRVEKAAMKMEIHSWWSLGRDEEFKNVCNLMRWKFKKEWIQRNEMNKGLEI